QRVLDVSRYRALSPAWSDRRYALRETLTHLPRRVHGPCIRGTLQVSLTAGDVDVHVREISHLNPRVPRTQHDPRRAHRRFRSRSMKRSCRTWRWRMTTTDCGWLSIACSASRTTPGVSADARSRSCRGQGANLRCRFDTAAEDV